MIRKGKKAYVSLVLVVLIGLLCSCEGNKVFEGFRDFKQGFWSQDSVVTFNFKIEDAGLSYNLMAHFRNSQNYPYHNMYYRYALKNDMGTVLDERLMQIFLFDKKTGKPNGGGIGDLFDNSQAILKDYTFYKAGDYSVELKQHMRMDSLPSILSVGWRVEVVD